MADFEVSIASNIKEMQRQLSAFANQQLPFATALALTALAKKAKEAEVKNLSAKLDRPTPFTLRSVGSTAARKDTLTSTIYMRDLTAVYLEPFEFGGMHKQNGPKILNPVGAQVNAYGNLPKGTWKRLQARKDVFVGIVKTKSGESINGVWQRPFVRARTKVRGRPATPRGANTTGKLKLLLRLDGPKAVTQHLDYMQIAKRVVAINFDREMGKALARAIASAR